MTMSDSEESRVARSLPVLTKGAVPIGRLCRPSGGLLGAIGMPLPPSSRTDEDRL